ncbi:MAG TPA: Crp/Fnr family transcriptional regulator [Candidatus Saccharimonadales bacterium]|nr:Crp/Fnr family transcriptional regulator [Candidatus Saccharimonadales bacterium]
MSEVTDKIHRTLSQYPKRQYPKGQILVFADESPRYIYYITKGKIIQYDVSYRGDEIIVNVYKPPAFFPMSWAINETHNSYFYKTEGMTEVHVVPANKALEFLKNNPDVMYDLISRLYKGIDGLLARMVQLMSGTAKSRLLYEIAIEARRFGEQQSDGSYRININESELAARAGLSRETVNWELSKVKKANLVKIDKNVITLPDLQAIELTIGQTE